MKWPVPQTFADVEKTVPAFVFFVEVSLISVQDVQGPRSFRLVPVRIVSIGFGDGASGEGVNLEVQIQRQPEWCREETDHWYETRLGKIANRRSFLEGVFCS